MSNYPPEFNNVISQLETLANTGSIISGRVAQLKANLKSSLDSLNDISSRTASISDLINRLKASLAELERKNEELERMLREGRANFESQMSELQQRQRNELEEERLRLVAEKEELQRSFAESTEMSQSERESAIREAEQAANERAREQTEAIQKAHEEERTKLVAQYQKDYNGLLEALTRIAESQARAIGQINGELDESEALTTEFATVQQQILGLLASISEILNDGHAQGSVPPPPSFGQRQLLPVGSPSEELEENYLAPENIDLDELEASEEPMPEQVSNIPTEREELFKFMLRTLAQRARTGLGANVLQDYEQLKGNLRDWKFTSNRPDANLEDLKRKKLYAYRMTTLLFNKTNDISPTSTQLTLQAGGRRTRRHRRRVHFKTRANKGRKCGKKGGKKRGRKSHKGGKRSGGKRTRKH